MFHGSMVAMVTPMAEDGSLDFTALANLVEFHIDNGTDAIVAVGTTGESATIDFDEHGEVVRRVVEQVKGRIPVIAGTGANATAEALHLTREAMEAGADACLLVTPYYNKPPQKGLYQHYKTIADQVAIPQILYNVPGRTGCDMQPETVEKLSHIPNIIGIKEASTLARIKDLIQRCGDRMDIYSGDDPVTLETIQAGGKGVISVTANVAPKAMHDLCAAALAGDRATAEQLDAMLQPLHKALFTEPSPIPTKWAVAQLGLIKNSLRLPMVPLSEPGQVLVREAMHKTHIF